MLWRRRAITAVAVLVAALAACEAPPRESSQTAHEPPAAAEGAAAGDPLDPLGPGGDEATAEQDDDDQPLTLSQWNRRWSKLLSSTVDRRTGGVDYNRLRRERETLSELLESLALERRFADDRERLAFLINGYNLVVVAAVLDQPTLPGSVRDIHGFFNMREYRVLGDRYTLDQLRDQLIRPLEEPLAHFALVNGAIGSPPLLHMAYTADELDEQLAYQLERFLSDPVRNTAIGPTVMLSPIFRWFSSDFEAAASDGTLAGYLREHAPEDSRVAQRLHGRDEPPIAFLDFNWALNYVRVPAPPDQDTDDEADEDVEDEDAGDDDEPATSAED